MPYIQTLDKQWSLSMDINPAGTVQGLSNIIHIGTGGDQGVYGYRTPAIMFYPGTTRLQITSAINGETPYSINDCHTGPDTTIDIHRWTNVVVMQVLVLNGYQFIVKLNGLPVFSVYNTDPQEFENVKVSSSYN